jgi:predicted DNA-binding protein
MAQLTIELSDADYQRLEESAQHIGKAVQILVQEWIRQLLPELEETFDVSQDPVYQMEGYDSEAPGDLSINLDKYLYGEVYPKSFADANGWIALNSKRDQLHDIAVSVNRDLLSKGHRYITTNFVLDESYLSSYFF